MPAKTPLRAIHESFVRDENDRHSRAVAQASRGTGAAVRSEVSWIPYGPANADGSPLCEVVAAYGAPEVEYAAIRRSAALMDACHRGTLEISGADRVAFLQRMVTQDVGTLAPGEVREAFRLNRKGRIDADLLIAAMPERLLVDLDVHVAAPVAQELSRFTLAEDVSVVDGTDQTARLSIHGPHAGSALDAASRGVGVAPAAGDVAGSIAPAPANISDIADLRAGAMSIAGAPVALVRRDQCGVPGYELFVPASAAERVWRALIELPDPANPSRRLVRPVGWEAYNIARIEAGTPLFQIDFGPDSLPHETSLLQRRVSFRKGCYLGQEVVARMESLGKPKQVVARFRMDDDLLPIAGAQVFSRADDGSMGAQVGVVTSSTVSPMMGRACIGFATLRLAAAAPGTRLLISGDGAQGGAVVLPALSGAEATS